MTPYSADAVNDMTLPQLTKPGVPAGVKWGFNYPLSFTMISASQFVVADTGARRLIVIRDNGDLLRIIPLDAGSTPYFHPTRVSHLRDGVVLVASVRGDFVILDTSRPWIRSDAALPGVDIGGGAFPVTMAVTSTGDDDISLIIHNEKLNTILRYKVATTDNFDDVPPPLPSEGENMIVPNRWSHRDGELWMSYILSESGAKRLTLSQVRGFFDTCLNVAKASLTNLDETEGDICKTVAKIHELEHSDERSSDTLKAISLEHFECNKSIRKRVASRKAFADSLSLVIRVVCANHDLDGVTALKDELTAILDSELTQRKRVCEDIVSWARGNLEKAETFHSPAFAHALTALIFIMEHIDLLLKALRFIGDEKADFDMALPKALSEYAHSTAGFGQDKFTYHAYDAYFIAGILSEEFGFANTALCAYRLAFKKNRRHWASHALSLFALKITSAISPMDQLSAGEYFANSTSDPEVALVFGDTATYHGLYDVLAPLVDRFENASSDTVIISRWKELARKRKALGNTRRFSISLSEGESSAEKIKLITGAEPPREAVLRYVKSLKVSHPDLDSVFSPCLSRLTAQGSLLVSGLDGGLALLDERGDCKVIWNELGLMVSGMDIISHQEAIALIERRQPTPQHVKTILINLISGSYKEISPKNASQMPRDPFRIINTESGSLVVSGREVSGEERLWVVDKSFSSGSPLGAPQTGLISDLTSLNDDVAITFYMANAVYRISLDGNITQICSPGHSICPGGVAMVDGGIVFTTDQWGLGLQVFRESDYLYQITDVSCGSGNVRLRHGALSRLKGKFMNGNLLLSDYFNGFIHIFQCS